MANWLDVIKDKLGDLQESIGGLPFIYQWLISGLILFIIILVGLGIIKIFQFLF